MKLIETSGFVILLFCGFCSAQDQYGFSTHYWDCCKPACSWSGTEPAGHPVWSCAIDGWTHLDDFNAQSGCGDGGWAFTCANNQPWAVDDNLAYGFAAVVISGQDMYSTCCACYEMTFASGPPAGKRMVVQVTNTGADLGSNQFDIQIPGGGVGIYNGCTAQYGAPPDGWGQRYGGTTYRDECYDLPGELQPGCFFRYDWLYDANNDFTFHRVGCPSVLTDITGCIRSDEATFML